MFLLQQQMHTRKDGPHLFSTGYTNNDYLGSTASKSQSTRYSKFYNPHTAPVQTPPSLTSNRVFQFIASESQGEKLIKEQERVLLALDRAKIDLKKKGVIVDEPVNEPHWRRKKQTP